jgi:hypothetical protein
MYSGYFWSLSLRQLFEPTSAVQSLVAEKIWRDSQSFLTHKFLFNVVLSDAESFSLSEQYNWKFNTIENNKIYIKQ